MILRFETRPEGRAHIILRAYPETLEESEPKSLAVWAERTNGQLAIGQFPIRSPWRIQSNRYGAYLGTSILYSLEAAAFLRGLGWRERRYPR